VHVIQTPDEFEFSYAEHVRVGAGLLRLRAGKSEDSFAILRGKAHPVQDDINVSQKRGRRIFENPSAVVQ